MFYQTQPEKTKSEKERLGGISSPAVISPRISLASQRSPRFPKPQYSSSSPQISRSTRPTTARSSYRFSQSRYVIPVREPDPEGDLLLNENSEQIQKISTHILLGEPVDEKDPNILGMVVVDLMNKRNRLEEKGDYKESLHAQESIEVARQLQLEAKKEQVKSLALKDLELRKGHTETDVTIFNHKYEAEKVKIEMKFDEFEAQMKQRQREELIKHDQEWMSEKKNFQYVRISSKLRSMKEMREKLIRAKRYDEAHAIGEEAKKLEQQEEQEMQEKRANDYKRSLQNLLKKHEEEIKNLRDTRKARLDLLEIKTQSGEAIFENRKRAIKFNEEIASDKEKLWKLKHRNDQYSLRMSEGSVKKTKATGSLASTPRTQQLKLPPLVTKYI